jgi:capsular polysaccharide biosynthesis protein
VIFIGFWLALLGGVVAGYLAEVADPSIRTPAEVEKLLKIPTLAAMPRQVA